MAGRIDNVAIVGGGFTGAMLAARLAESGVASTLINATPDFGLGVAYSTPFDGHLLNVRSGRMGALAERPDDFLRWLEERHPALADPDGFAPRRLFGLYVQARLADVEAAHPGKIRRIVGEVCAVEAEGVRLKDQTLVAADAVVLATGNPAPRTAGGAAASNRVMPDPWAPGALDRIAPGDDVLIIGTGLTMVDVLLALDARGWRGRATALSRRGLLPRSHAPRPDAPTPPTEALRAGPLSLRLGEARRLAGLGGWRELMEGLRPVTADLWTQADLRMRGQIVRHLRPWWDVHRHRIAPAVAAVLARLDAEDRLRILAGRAGTVVADGDGVAVDWTPRRGPHRPALAASWLIDCTGPGHAPDLDPLTAPLIASGRARLDPLRLGLDLDPDGRVRGAGGVPDDRLFVLGPPARAAFWETIAVPDIRKRIEDVVAALCGDATA
ncbi:FAD-dependent oxidoreductase [Brevundimonas sp. LM2]|uniref:FAD/NAD(P)-binding protein n=1 Tax=Brevundimonas sp. LM2 TaxID=1938605 RepID=UPI000983A009|nr:FAD/NAD(P)-binding protein [Brevundimonas sp. LM2]AQR60670.1 FAD-dependent oxidoreductase [Brevundimonas sp. LM2]